MDIKLARLLEHIDKCVATFGEKIVFGQLM